MRSLFILASLTGLALADVDYGNYKTYFNGYDLNFEDDFPGNSLNTQYWTPDWDCTGWGNDARMCYTTNPKNLYVKDSMLVINPVCGRLQPDKSICTPHSGYPQCCCEPTNVDKMDSTSAQVTTRHKVTFQQGKIRVRAKLSTGYYTWPAMWMYLDWTPNGPIPASAEIDIMEGVGKMPDWWSAVIHYPVNGPNGGLADKTKYRNANTGMMFNESFHVFGVDWDEDTLTWVVDEKPMWTYKYTQLDKEGNGARNPYYDGGFHILLDVAIGGRMFGIGYGKNKPSYEELCADANQWTPTYFDWVRVYQKTGKKNITMNGPGPSTLPGSGGAACLFGGCVGSNWDQEVKDYERLHNISPDPVYKPGQNPAPAPAPDASKSVASQPTGVNADGPKPVPFGQASSAGKLTAFIGFLIALFV